MRFNLAVSFLVAASSVTVGGAAFVPSSCSSYIATASPACRSSFVLQQSTVSEAEAVKAAAAASSDKVATAVNNYAAAPSSSSPTTVVPLTSAEVKSRLTAQLETLRKKDSKSKKLSKEVSERRASTFLF
jgi:hypothetical protein